MFFRIVDPLVGGPGRLMLMNLNNAMTFAANYARQRNRRVQLRIDRRWNK